MSKTKDRVIEALNDYYADQRAMVRQEARTQQIPEPTQKRVRP